MTNDPIPQDGQAGGDDATQRLAATIGRLELVARREALGFTQSSLAAYLNVAQATVSRWETGSRAVPAWLAPILDQIEETVDVLVHATAAAAQKVTAAGGIPKLFVYATDTELACSLAGNEEGLPASAHRVAMARARRLIDPSPPLLDPGS